MLYIQLTRIDHSMIIAVESFQSGDCNVNIV